MNEANLVIFGCGGHSRSVADIVLKNDPNVTLLFVDENARTGERILGHQLVREMPVHVSECFFALGDNLRRKQCADSMDGVNLARVISSSAHIGLMSSVGSGTFVGNFCHVGPEVVVGKNTIVNNASILEHEVKIGSFSHVGPGVTISGRCVIGDLVFIGVGATVKDSIHICSNVVVGAGAVVVKDITEPGIYAGVPARKIK